MYLGTSQRLAAQAFNFAFSPMWLRVPFVSFVSALWTAYVSIVRGNDAIVEAKQSSEGAGMFARRISK